MSVRPTIRSRGYWPLNGPGYLVKFPRALKRPAGALPD